MTITPSIARSGCRSRWSYPHCNAASAQRGNIDSDQVLQRRDLPHQRRIASDTIAHKRDVIFSRCVSLPRYISTSAVKDKPNAGPTFRIPDEMLIQVNRHISTAHMLGTR
jgi:hypothetical protein